MSIKNIAIFTTLFYSLPLVAMERSDYHSVKRLRSDTESSDASELSVRRLRTRTIVSNNNNQALSWDTQFKTPFYLHGRVSAQEFLIMPQCLIEPLWDAHQAQGDIRALAEFIYFSLPAINHRAACTKCRGSSYIHLLAASGNVELVREILALHALVGRRDKVDLANMKASCKQTPLHFIVGDEDKFKGKSQGNLAMVQLLLDHSADHLVQDTGYEITPLGLAMLSRRPECSRIADQLLTLRGSRTDKSVFEYLATEYVNGGLPDPGTYPILERHCGSYENLCKRVEDEVQELEMFESDSSSSSSEGESDSE